MSETLVVCNVNRHVGLALLLSGTYFRNQKALPAIAAYALAAQLMIWLYAKLASHVGLPRNQVHHIVEIRQPTYFFPDWLVR